jgi:hypothetical protein
MNSPRPNATSPYSCGEPSVFVASRQTPDGQSHDVRYCDRKSPDDLVPMWNHSA